MPCGLNTVSKHVYPPKKLSYGHLDKNNYQNITKALTHIKNDLVSGINDQLFVKLWCQLSEKHS